MNQNGFYFLVGAGLGISTAVIGALIDWLRMRRFPDPRNGRLPGCMMLVLGALGFLGVLMILTTWLLTGSPRTAIAAGVGVISGFFLAFAFLASTWLLNDFLSTRKSNKKELNKI